MDVSSMAAAALAMTQQQTAEAINIAVLKKTLEIQADSMATLMEAMTQAAPSNPPHLGNSIDTTA